MRKNQKLLELQKRILIDSITPDLEKSATKLVFGSGSVDADIMFIGEAPGKKEDISGEPFVGASGKMLDDMLNSVNIRREEVYITNIVKYRPPNNRDPLPSEKKAFWPYLVEQINIIKPKVIATLGRHSGQAFIPSLRISADHGEPQSVKIQMGTSESELTVIPLYHPAAALYNGSLKATLFQDFKKMREVL